MADYSSSTDVRANLPEGGFSSTDYDTVISSYLTVSSRLIDAYLGVEANFFSPSTDTVMRYYDGTGTPEIRIDPFASISSVAVTEGAGLASSDYITWYTSDNDYYVTPYNYVSLGLPITGLVADYNGDKGGFIALPKAVQVTGIAGYSTAVPELIAKACEVQTIYMLMQSKQAFQSQGGNDKMPTDISDSLCPAAKMMLLPYSIQRFV